MKQIRALNLSRLSLSRFILQITAFFFFIMSSGFAMDNNDEEIVKKVNILKFSENKGDINSQKYIRGTPLTYSIELGDTIFAKILIENKADVNTVNKKLAQYSPLSLAIQAVPRFEFIQYLIANKANINALDEDLMSPLIHVCMASINNDNVSNWRLAELLISNKADVNLEDKKGNSAYIYAEQNQDLDTMNLILEHHPHIANEGIIYIINHLKEQRMKDTTLITEKQLINSKDFNAEVTKNPEAVLWALKELTINLLLEHLSFAHKINTDNCQLVIGGWAEDSIAYMPEIVPSSLKIMIIIMNYLSL